MEIKLYKKNRCIQCNATERAFNKWLPDDEIINTVNVDETPGAAEELIDKGFRQTPVVEVSDYPEPGQSESWSGYRPDKIREIANAAIRFSQ